MKRTPKIEVFQDRTLNWRWHLAAANGKTVCQGESHGTKRDAKRAATAVQKAFARAIFAA